MVNPFDRSFFKFLIGFICILGLAFLILYIVGQWGGALDQQTAGMFN